MSATTKEDLKAFKDLDLTDDETNQISMILENYSKPFSIISKDHPETSGFSAVLRSKDINMVSIDQLIIQLNDFSPEFKLLDSNKQLRDDP